METQTRYIAHLTNAQRCTYDTLQSDNRKEIKSWARREGVSTLEILDRKTGDKDIFICTDYRCKYQYSERFNF